jgi:hypothetical protein
VKRYEDGRTVETNQFRIHTQRFPFLQRTRNTMTKFSDAGVTVLEMPSPALPLKFGNSGHNETQVVVYQRLYAIGEELLTETKNLEQATDD